MSRALRDLREAEKLERHLRLRREENRQEKAKLDVLWSRAMEAVQQARADVEREEAARPRA